MKKGSNAPYMTPELEHFRGLVKQMGLTHAQLAERLGLSESYVKNIISGWHRMPPECAAHLIGCKPYEPSSPEQLVATRSRAVAFPVTGAEYAECLAACFKTNYTLEELAAFATMNFVHGITEGRVQLPRKDRHDPIP